MVASFKAKIVSLGRITIPSKLRAKLQLKEGDIVQVEGLSKLIPEKEA